MPGWFDLKTPTDLLAKLHRDYDKLEKSPRDVDLAFNFFVTALHMLDWEIPGMKTAADKRRSIEKSEILLQVTSHLANGAKHFVAEAKHHTSVKNTGRSGGHFPSGHFPKNYFPAGYFGAERLVVALDGDAAQQFGATIDVITLAQMVLAFWDVRLQSDAANSDRVQT